MSTKRSSATSLSTAEPAAKRVMHPSCNCTGVIVSVAKTIYCHTCKDLPQCKAVRHKPDTTPEPTEPELTSELACPICCILPQGKVYQCSNGHVICEACLNQHRISSNYCPTCRGYIPRHNTPRNLLVEKLIQKMTHLVKCTHDDCGKLVEFNRLNEHAEICDYKIVDCDYGLLVECKWSGYAKDKKRHEKDCKGPRMTVENIVALAHPEWTKCKFAPFGCSFVGTSGGGYAHVLLECPYAKKPVKELLECRRRVLEVEEAQFVDYELPTPSYSPTSPTHEPVYEPID